MAASEIARFQILGVLGTGAQGVVVLARDHEDASTEPLVLKVLRRDPEATSLVRLREEARILAWLRHPNIVKVHRLLEKDGLPIVVMEHIEGASALEQVRTRGRMPAPVALEIARRAALALDAAYNAAGPDGRPMRIVHRDVKPANLLVSGRGEVKVVDFGIATGAFEDADPDADEFMGTPGYIAPERRNGGADSPAVDVYALGASLFLLLSGKVLVLPMSTGRHDLALARSLSHLVPEDADAAAARAIRSVVADMCRYDPSARPSLPGLVQRLDAVAARLGPPDLGAWARTAIAPIVASRPPRWDPSHPHRPDLAFLEEGGDVRDLGVETPGPPRRLALRPIDPPPVQIEPMLAKLETRPWWWFWHPSNDPAILVEALVALRGTRDPRAVTRAYELTRHDDPRVTEAAWDLLAAAC